MSGTAILIHGGTSVRAAYESALAGSGLTFHVVFKGGYSSSYQALAEASSLEEFVHEVAPEWTEGEPLVLIAFSAGGWAVRHWLHDARARELATAVVILDGMHSSGDDDHCDPDKLDGIFAYADLARGSPEEHLLVVTTTDIVPPGYASTSACAAELLSHVDAPAGAKRDEGEVPGVVVIDEGGTTAADHGKQQTSIGPEVLETIVVPWLGGDFHPGKSSGSWMFVALIGATAFGWWLMSKRGINSTRRSRRYA